MPEINAEQHNNGRHNAMSQNLAFKPVWIRDSLTFPKVIQTLRRQGL